MCDTNRISKVSSHLEYSNDFSLKDHIIVETKIPQYRSFSFAETNPSIGGEVSPEIKAVGDLNNDGIDDLIIDYYETSIPPVILLGTKNGKFVELKYNTKNASRRHIRNAELADLNNDGWLDFIGFTTGDSGKIWEKSGYSTFGNSIPRGQEDIVLINKDGKDFYALTIPETRTNDWNHGGTTADLNNDGWIDILPLSEGEKEFTAPIKNLDGKRFILSEHEYSKDISFYITSDIDAGDINNDGYQDLVVATTNINYQKPSDNNKIGTLRVIFGDGDFDFSNNMEFKLGSIWLSDKLGENIANQFKGKMKAGAGHDSSKIKTGTSNVELVDIDGDGYLDILEGQFHTVSGLWSGSGFKLYRFNGNCFEDATSKFFPNQFSNRNIKNNFFATYIHNFKMADINQDNLKDLILQIDGGADQGWYNNEENIGYPNIFINTKNNEFLPVNFKDKNFSPIMNIDDLLPGDFNGDGKIDLIGIASRFKPKLRVFLNDSNLNNVFIPENLFSNNLHCEFKISRNLNNQKDDISFGEINIIKGKVYFDEEWKTGINGNQQNILEKDSNLFVESNGNLQGYFPVYPMFNSGLIELLFFEENIKKINLKDSNRNFSSWEIEKDIFINLQITKCNHLENISLKKINKSSEVSQSIKIPSPDNLYKSKLKCDFRIDRFLSNENDTKKIAEGVLNIIDGKAKFISENWRTGPNNLKDNILTNHSKIHVLQDGGLIGEASIYFLFGNDEKEKLNFINQFQSLNKNFKPEGENIVKLRNNNKIDFKISNCENVINEKISSNIELSCNFSLIRNLLNENEISEIAKGKFKLHNGNIIFIDEEWKTGGNINNKNILKEVSNLNLDKNGFLIGSLPIYTMFGNDEVRVLDVKKKVISDQKWISGTHELGIIENHIKILLKPENCKK